MNSYLIQLANNLPQIRRVLAITQKELAEKVGISRPTLLKIEQSPDRLTKVTALGIYVVTNALIQEDLKKIRKMKQRTYDTKESVQDLIRETNTYHTLTSTNVSVAASLSSIPILGALGDGVTNILKGLFSKGKKDEAKDEKHLSRMLSGVAIDDELSESITKFLDDLKKQIIDKNESCLELFQLEDWEPDEFIKKIEINELQ